MQEGFFLETLDFNFFLKLIDRYRTSPLVCSLKYSTKSIPTSSHSKSEYTYNYDELNRLQYVH